MLDRLAGLETEYAIRFSPAGQGGRPSNDAIYDAIAASVSAIVGTRPGRRRLLHKQLFTQNGGSIYYEAVPSNLTGGVIEGGSPECRGPSQLLLYQRAQDALLQRALPDAERRLEAAGHPGTLGLLKNCRDAEGHVYGAQENYDAELASGGRLLAYRALLGALMIPLVASVLATWALALGLLGVALALVPAAIVVVIVGSVIAELVPAVARWASRFDGKAFGAKADLWLMRVFQGLELVMWWPVLLPYVWLVRWLAFRRVRRGGEAFFLSRAALSGAGTLEAGALHLAEKGVALARTARATALPVERALFDPGNLVKGLTKPATFKLRPLLALFRRRQRLQLGLSDSNCAQVAEYLKLGTTMLVIDLAEAGRLGGAPQLARPVADFRRLNADPTLTLAVDTVGHGPMRMLDLQRWYLEAAGAWLAEAPTTSLEAREVLTAWRETLDALETDPEALVGRIDWVTKRTLIARAGFGASEAVNKKIDLRYHELGTGYFAELDARGLAPRLVEEADIDAAIETPPEDSPAWVRGRLVQRLARSGTRASVSWQEVRVGGPIGGKVIRLSEWRARQRVRGDDGAG